MTTKFLQTPDRQFLKPYLGQPVLLIGVVGDEYKKASQMQLISSGDLISPKIAILPNNYRLKVDRLKTGHCWVPSQKKLKQGEELFFMFIVDLYTREDGTQSYGFRNPITPLEIIDCKLRLLAVNVDTLLNSKFINDAEKFQLEVLKSIEEQIEDVFDQEKIKKNDFAALTLLGVEKDILRYCVNCYFEIKKRIDFLENIKPMQKRKAARKSKKRTRDKSKAFARAS
ncbi:MAG: hypothetical protein AAFO95_05435 [Cyanobacteria bacterium J06600_6]